MLHIVDSDPITTIRIGPLLYVCIRTPGRSPRITWAWNYRILYSTARRENAWRDYFGESVED